ncbi:MAG: SNF2-related protein [Burkholderiales bacterium]
MNFLLSKERRAVIVPGGPGFPALIPSAKPLDIQGKRLWAVPFELDEATKLRKLGFMVPSPIGSYYDWPRELSKIPEPFHNQIETAAFLTLNKRAYCLNDIGCVDSETEYLSPTGWRRIDKYDGGAVAQYWPETGRVDFVEQPEYVKLPCDTMVRVKTKYGIDQLLSPEHRMLLADMSGSGKTEVVQAHDMLSRQADWHRGASKKSTKHIGFCKSAIPTTFVGPERVGVALTEAELRLQIAVVADGSFPSPSTTRCAIRVKKERKKNRLRALLLAAGVKYSERSRDYASAVGFSTFMFNAPLREKSFGAWAWGMSRAQLAVFTDEVMHWDGCAREGKPTSEFSTRVKESADFVQYAFASTGKTARLTAHTRSGGAVDYAVVVRDNGAPLGLAGTQRSGTKTSPLSMAPSTDGFKYCFMVPSTFLVFRRNGCVFLSGNTGKTMSALWAADYLLSIGAIRKVLFISPLSTLDRVWGDAVFEHMGHRSIAVLHGTAAKRKKLFANSAFDFYVVNHDGIDIITEMIYKDVKGQRKLVGAKLLRDDIDLVIIDELAVLRNQQTARWRVTKKATADVPWMWGLTGTPTPNSPTDAYAQLQLVTPDNPNVPGYFTSFRQMVCQQLTEYIWIPRKEAAAIVNSLMQPSIRFVRDECMDLPPCTYSTREVDLSPDQAKHYKELVKELYTEINGGKITAANEGVKMGKLLQIACGVVYDKEGKEQVVDAVPRINEVKRIIEEAGHKVIVFVPYTAPLEALHEELTKWLEPAGLRCAMIHGGVSRSNRGTIFTEFQKRPDLRVLVADAGCMSHGLTLTEANTIVWYAPEFSNDVYQQANGRITRPGQKNAQFIIHIEGTELERRLYKRLEQRGSTQGLLLKLAAENKLSD